MAALEEDVEGVYVGTGGRADGVEGLVEVDCFAEVLEGNGGLNAGVDSCNRNSFFGALKVLELGEGFLWAGWFFGEIGVERVQGAGREFEARFLHNKNDRKGSWEVIGVEVTFDEGFVVVRCEDGFALSKDAKNICGEADFTLARSNGEDVETGTCRGLEVPWKNLGVPY